MFQLRTTQLASLTQQLVFVLKDLNRHANRQIPNWCKCCATGHNLNNWNLGDWLGWGVWEGSKRYSSMVLSEGKRLCMWAGFCMSSAQGLDYWITRKKSSPPSSPPFSTESLVAARILNHFLKNLKQKASLTMDFWCFFFVGSSNLMAKKATGTGPDRQKISESVQIASGSPLVRFALQMAPCMHPGWTPHKNHHKTMAGEAFCLRFF